MPITEEVQRKLLQEAEEKSGARAPQRLPNMNDAGGRLQMASVMLGNALDTADKANASVRSAMAFFLAEWQAALAAGVNPATLQQQASGAVDRVTQAIKPKTFGQQTDT